MKIMIRAKKTSPMKTRVRAMKRKKIKVLMTKKTPTTKKRIKVRKMAMIIVLKKWLKIIVKRTNLELTI